MNSRNTLKQISARVLSVMTAIGMIFSIVPSTVFAEDADTSSDPETPGKVITSFADSYTKTATVDSGTEKDDAAAGLSATLTATIQDSETPEEVAVTWNSDDYDAATAGDYTFTAVLTDTENYQLAEGAAMPTAAVTVSEAKVPEPEETDDSTVIAVQNAPAIAAAATDSTSDDKDTESDIPDPEPAVKTLSKSKTVTNLDSSYTSNVTLSLPAKDTPLVSDIVFVLDKSSCKKETAEQAEALLKELNSALQTTKAQIKIGVTAFDGDSHNLYELTDYDGSSEQETEILSMLAANSIPEGEKVHGTNMQAGLIAADKMLQADTAVNNDRKYVILISDGLTRLFTGTDGKVKDIYYQYSYDDPYGINPDTKPNTFVYYGMIDEWDNVRNGDSQAHYNLPYGSWSEYWSHVKTWVQQDGDTYAFDYSTYGDDASDEVKDGSAAAAGFQYIEHTDFANHAMSVDRAVYEAYMQYAAMVKEGYKCYAVNSGTSEFSKAFMYQLNVLSGNDTEDNQPVIGFSEIRNDILYLLDRGSMVIDEIGSGSDYNFDFNNSLDTLKLTVNGVELTGEKISEDSKVTAYGFRDGSQPDQEYQFGLEYYPDGTTYEGVTYGECLVWVILTKVSYFAPVQLTYQVKLINPKTAAGTYGTYDKDGSQGFDGLYTNNSATLIPVDSFEHKGEPEEFNKPTVSYTVTAPAPAPTPTSTSGTADQSDQYLVTFLDCNGNTVKVEWVTAGGNATAPIGFGSYSGCQNVTSHRDLKPTSCSVNNKWVVPNTADRS